MTIEEMANSAYFMQQHSGSLTEEEYEDVKHGIKVRRKAYIKGANAVLEKIEKALNQAQYYSDMSCKNKLYEDMLKFIEQLKKK